MKRATLLQTCFLLSACTTTPLFAQSANNGWEFLIPPGSTAVYSDQGLMPRHYVWAAIHWDPDGTGSHAGFIVVSGRFTIETTSGPTTGTALFDLTYQQWLPLDPAVTTLASSLIVEPQSDGTQSLLVVGTVVSGTTVHSAAILNHGTWQFFGRASGLGLIEFSRVVSWNESGQRFIAVATPYQPPVLYANGRWSPFGQADAAWLPSTPPTKTLTGFVSESGLRLAYAESGFLQLNSNQQWAAMGIVRETHGTSALFEPRADGGADLIAGIRDPLTRRQGIGRWDGSTWETIAPDADGIEIIPVPNASGARQYLMTNSYGYLNVEGVLTSAPMLWNGTDWRSLRYPSGRNQVAFAVLGPGAPGQQDIYVAGNLRDPSTNAFTVLARLPWQNVRPTRCFRTDFNANGVFGESSDVTAFFEALAGAPRSPWISDIDINRNGVFPEDQDVVDFLSLFVNECNE